MRISDWSSDVCSSDLLARGQQVLGLAPVDIGDGYVGQMDDRRAPPADVEGPDLDAAPGRGRGTVADPGGAAGQGEGAGRHAGGDHHCDPSAPAEPDPPPCHRPAPAFATTVNTPGGASVP